MTVSSIFLAQEAAIGSTVNVVLVATLLLLFSLLLPVALVQRWQRRQQQQQQRAQLLAELPDSQEEDEGGGSQLPYRVDPTDPEYIQFRLSDYERANVNSSNGLVFVLSGLPVLPVAVGVFGGVGFLVGSGAVILFTALVGRAIKADRIDALELARSDVAYKEACNEARQNALVLSADLRSRLDACPEEVYRIQEELEHASGWLSRARREFEDSAYAPFWDAVEHAARRLAAFNGGVRSLAAEADYYYRMLLLRSHTFPPFPVAVDDLPDAAPVVAEFHTVVRMGLTVFHFANIWEHRCTRGVLVAGFRTLAEAVSSIGYSIESSISTLSDSVSSSAALVVREQIETRDALVEHLGSRKALTDAVAQSNRTLSHLERDVREIRRRTP